MRIENVDILLPRWTLKLGQYSFPPGNILDYRPQENVWKSAMG